MSYINQWMLLFQLFLQIGTMKPIYLGNLEAVLLIITSHNLYHLGLDFLNFNDGNYHFMTNLVNIKPVSELHDLFILNSKNR